MVCTGERVQRTRIFAVGRPLNDSHCMPAGNGKASFGVCTAGISTCVQDVGLLRVDTVDSTPTTSTPGQHTRISDFPQKILSPCVENAMHGSTANPTPSTSSSPRVTSPLLFAAHFQRRFFRTPSNPSVSSQTRGGGIDGAPNKGGRLPHNGRNCWVVLGV
jgi:hypothetical protein